MFLPLCSFIPHRFQQGEAMVRTFFRCLLSALFLMTAHPLTQAETDITSPPPVSVISSEEIEKSPPSNISEIIKTQPGIAANASNGQTPDLSGLTRSEER